jgi:hypothetical protein
MTWMGKLIAQIKATVAVILFAVNGEKNDLWVKGKP